MELTEMNILENITPLASSYMRFIGTQATRGNVLMRNKKAVARNGEHPFKGSDVIKFIENIT